MASGRVLQTVVLLAQGAALSLAPSFAVVSQVVQNARFRFKDHILHLNPRLVLELLELLLVLLLEHPRVHQVSSRDA